MEPKDEKINFYRFEFKEGVIIGDDSDYILECIKEDIAHLDDRPAEVKEYKITIIQMTQEEYDSINEFEVL